VEGRNKTTVIPMSNRKGGPIIRQKKCKGRMSREYVMETTAESPTTASHAGGSVGRIRAKSDMRYGDQRSFFRGCGVGPGPVHGE